MCDRVLCYMFILYMNEATCFYTYSNSSLFCKSFKTFDDTYNVCRIYYPIDASMHLQAAPACARGVAQPPSRYRRRDRGRGRRMDALSARHGRLPVPEHARTRTYSYRAGRCRGETMIDRSADWDWDDDASCAGGPGGGWRARGQRQ